MTFYYRDIKDLKHIAIELLSHYKDERIFAFFGKMGIGKTTFIKEICRVLNVRNIVCSPTFSIVNEYATIGGQKIYHFDFYRVKNLQEVYDIGYEEYFYSGDYCFIEWSENIEFLLPQNYIRIEMEETSDGERKIFANKIF